MTVFEKRNKYSRNLDIQPFGDRTMVTVSQHASLADFKWGDAYVNWSAIGDVTPDQAIEFAEALRIAANQAARWSVDTGKVVE